MSTGHIALKDTMSSSHGATDDFGLRLTRKRVPRAVSEARGVLRGGALTTNLSAITVDEEKHAATVS